MHTKAPATNGCGAKRGPQNSVRIPPEEVEEERVASMTHAGVNERRGPWLLPPRGTVVTVRLTGCGQ